MKRAVFILLKIIESIFALILLWGCAAFLLPEIPVNKNFRACSDQDCLTIYLRSNGMHTDIVFPVETEIFTWNSIFPYTTFHGVDTTFQYVAVGWGSKEFYLNTPTWDDVKISSALKAASGMDGTAIHVSYLKRPPSITDGYGQSIQISGEQYQIMLNYIDAALQKDQQDQPILITNPGYDEYDNYYEAKGRYSVFKTCNVWTSDCLKKAGIRNGFWTPLAASVIESSQ